VLADGDLDVGARQSLDHHPRRGMIGNHYHPYISVNQTGIASPLPPRQSRATVHRPPRRRGVGDDDDPVADLTDPRVVHEQAVRARAAGADIEQSRTYAEMAEVRYEYHVQLLALMEEALGDSPTAEQQAVYDAQQAKVDEARRFMEAAGIGARSTGIWAN